MNLLQRFSTHVQETILLKPGDHILVAVSAGADSMALLKLLQLSAASQHYQLGIVHVNHELRAESVDEAAYLATYCADNRLPFYQTNWKKADHPEHGIEQAAREFRYQYFLTTALAHGYQKVLTAHHGDDQLENLLMGLVRSGNINEIQSLQDRRLLAAGEHIELIRPLLPFGKQDLAHFIDEQKVTFFEDATNKERFTLRNRLRLDVVPQLKAESAQILPHTLRFFSELKGIQALAEQSIAQALGHLELIPIGGRVLGWHGEWGLLSVYNLEERLIILQRLFQKKSIRVSQRQLFQINALLMNQKKPQGSVDLGGNWQFYKRYDELTIQKGGNQHAKPPVAHLNLKLNAYYPLPNGRTEIGVFTKTTLDNSGQVAFKLRQRQAGDFITLRSGQHQSLKHFLINHKIPKEIRNEMFVIAQDNHVYWAVNPANSELLIQPQTDKMNYILKYKGERH